MKSRIQTCVTYFSSTLCCSLCLYLSFLFSLCLCCMCICSLFLYLLSFSSLRPLFFFFFFCVPLSIYREIPKKLFIALLSTDRSWSSFCQFFPAQLLISCSAVTHFSAFFSFLCSVSF